MAPCLLGEHIEPACPKCGSSFDCDPRLDSVALGATCPNCGEKVVVEDSHVLAGDRVLIDRSAFYFRRPRRWEVVAFHHAGPKQDLVVKRIVGLPGERIQLEHGDVYTDGRIQRKTLYQQRAVRILVHDAGFPADPPRWREQGTAGNWAQKEGELIHAATRSEDIDWLVYHHRVGSGDRQPTGPITSFGNYNHGQMQRNEDIRPVADVMMSLRMTHLEGQGRFWLQITDSRDQYMIELDSRRATYAAYRNLQPLAGVSGTLPPSLEGQLLELSLFDRQLLFAVSGRTLVNEALDADDGTQPTGSATPLAIGVQGLAVTLDRLRVYRDVYYTYPLASLHRDGTADACLGPDEYYVLGDNSPISEDSRTWGVNRFVTRKSMIGKPFLAIYPARELVLGKWHTQVPDLSKIRYIR